MRLELSFLFEAMHIISLLKFKPPYNPLKMVLHAVCVQAWVLWSLKMNIWHALSIFFPAQFVEEDNYFRTHTSHSISTGNSSQPSFYMIESRHAVSERMSTFHACAYVRVCVACVVVMCRFYSFNVIVCHQEKKSSFLPTLQRNNRKLWTQS